MFPSEPDRRCNNLILHLHLIDPESTEVYFHHVVYVLSPISGKCAAQATTALLSLPFLGI